MNLAERIETARLVLRRPTAADAAAVFEWASDPTATRFMSWPRHRLMADSEDFLRFSDVEWDMWPAGPFAIELSSTGQLIGSRGFAFRRPRLAEVGYILAPTIWGRGYATESLAAQVEAARVLAPLTLGASVHPDNGASARVLEKCGFRPDESPTPPVVFPNLQPSGSVPPLRFTRAVDWPATQGLGGNHPSPRRSARR